MHLPGDAERNRASTVESRIDCYFESATLAFELAVSATMRESSCSRMVAVLRLDAAWRRQSERKWRGR